MSAVRALAAHRRRAARRGPPGRGVLRPVLRRRGARTSRCSSWSPPRWSAGPEFAAVLGFFGGLAIDLAPPADHVAGRWALALVVVGYLAGRVRQDAGTSAIAAVVTVAASSFVGTSVFALSGMLLRRPGHPGRRGAPGDPGRGRSTTCCSRPFVLPLVMRLFRRLAAAPGRVLMARRSTTRRRRAARVQRDQGPAAPGRRAGAGAVAVRDAVRAAVVPPGRSAARPTRPRPPSSPSATSSCSRRAA